MRKIAILAAFLAALGSAADARGSRGASHPYYGGGHHTVIHGGHYSGSRSGSSHRGGHYVNPRTANRYGRHR
jgi:hypothetical protein